MTAKSNKKGELEAHYARRVKPEITGAPWLLRITQHKDKPVPLFIIKERFQSQQKTDPDHRTTSRSVLKERGLLYGPSQLRCLPVIRTIIGRVCDQAGIPLGLHEFLNGKRLTFRGNLPLDAEAGYKLSLIFKLQERLKELDRIELIARRVDRFTREEAGYWFSRISTYGDAANRWAMAGMKIMLAGHPKDPNIESMLENLRQSH